MTADDRRALAAWCTVGVRLPLVVAMIAAGVESCQRAGVEPFAATLTEWCCLTVLGAVTGGLLLSPVAVYVAWAAHTSPGFLTFRRRLILPALAVTVFFLGAQVHDLWHYGFGSGADGSLGDVAVGWLVLCAVADRIRRRCYPPPRLRVSF